MRLENSFNTRTVSLHLTELAESNTDFWLSSDRAALVLLLSATEVDERRGEADEGRLGKG